LPNETLPNNISFLVAYFINNRETFDLGNHC